MLEENFPPLPEPCDEDTETMEEAVRNGRNLCIVNVVYTKLEFVF